MKTTFVLTSCVFWFYFGTPYLWRGKLRVLHCQQKEGKQTSRFRWNVCGSCYDKRSILQDVLCKRWAGSRSITEVVTEPHSNCMDHSWEGEEGRLEGGGREWWQGWGVGVGAHTSKRLTSSSAVFGCILYVAWVSDANKNTLRGLNELSLIRSCYNGQLDWWEKNAFVYSSFFLTLYLTCLIPKHIHFFPPFLFINQKAPPKTNNNKKQQQQNNNNTTTQQTNKQTNKLTCPLIYMLHKLFNPPPPPPPLTLSEAESILNLIHWQRRFYNMHRV